MKRRVRVDSDDGGLDSLLDTMTNVVGILVLVLIVTQLGVADVLSRVVGQSEITPENLIESQQELVQQQQKRLELERVLYEPLDIDVEQLTQELRSKKHDLDEKRELLATKRRSIEDLSIRIERRKKQAEKAEQELEDSAKMRETLEQEILVSLKQKAQLEALIEDTPQTETPDDIVVSIPNPRPAPKGAKQILLICSDNRLYPVNTDRFRRAAEAKAKNLIARYKLHRGPTEGIDPKEFTKRFSQLKDQDDFFDVHYYVQDEKHPRLRFVPREGRGASTKEVQNRRSRIHKNLVNRIDPTKFFGRFFVLPDSFEIYTASRRAFSDSNILAGWEPQHKKWIYTTSVPGITLGPPDPKPPEPAKKGSSRKPTPPPNLID